LAWAGLGWPALACSGLGWAGLSWPGLGWPGLAWAELPWGPGLAWGGLGWPGLVWDGLGWPGLGWPWLAWAGLGWPGLTWAGLGSKPQGPRIPRSQDPRSQDPRIPGTGLRLSRTEFLLRCLRQEPYTMQRRGDCDPRRTLPMRSPKHLGPHLKCVSEEININQCIRQRKKSESTGSAETKRKTLKMLIFKGTGPFWGAVLPLGRGGAE